MNHEYHQIGAAAAKLADRLPHSVIIAVALVTAAKSELDHRHHETVEIVWTGPESADTRFRQTEQAILEVVNAATRHLTVVSYAVYRIPRIREALVAAANRGVVIRLVVETPNRILGFEPPLFIDIRIRRAVRANGFQGNAFEKLLGQDRHRWMQSLGNKFIQTRIGPTIQIAEPAAVDELLDLAVDLGRRKQRLLVFCSCQWPRCDGEINCHRATVAELVLTAAKKRGVQIEIASKVSVLFGTKDSLDRNKKRKQSSILRRPELEDQRRYRNRHLCR